MSGPELEQAVVRFALVVGGGGDARMPSALRVDPCHEVGRVNRFRKVRTTGLTESGSELILDRLQACRSRSDVARVGEVLHRIERRLRQRVVLRRNSLT